jgi:hypothetical protein
VGRLAVAFGTLKEADVDMEWVERFPREITPDRVGELQFFNLINLKVSI